MIWYGFVDYPKSKLLDTICIKAVTIAGIISGSCRHSPAKFDWMRGRRRRARCFGNIYENSFKSLFFYLSNLVAAVQLCLLYNCSFYIISYS